MRRSGQLPPDPPERGKGERGDTWTQHFIKTLHQKLHDPSLLQACPPPPPELFKHTDRNAALQEAAAGTGSLGVAAALATGHPDAWGAPAHPFTAPLGAYKLLSSDYAWLDAPTTAKTPARRGGGLGATAGAGAASLGAGVGGGGGSMGGGGGGSPTARGGGMTARGGSPTARGGGSPTARGGGSPTARGSARSGWGGGGGLGEGEGEGEDDESVPEPPLSMQQTRFLANARLVLIKLRQQLEEVCVGAVRRMEEAAAPPALGGPLPSALQTLASTTSGFFGTSGGGVGGGGALSVRGGGPGLSSAVSTGYGGLGGGPLGSSALSGTFSLGGGGQLGEAGHGGGGGGGGGRGGGGGGGGGRLPPGMADEIAENVRAKLSAAFEDCLSDTMDQLWGALQYAGSRHALVERMKQAMHLRETELEATAAQHREEAAKTLRALRRQKEEMEAAAEKERVKLKTLLVSSNQRCEALESELANRRAAQDQERASSSARLEALRVASETEIAARDAALEALRADSISRQEELRQAAAALEAQLRQRGEEVERLAARTAEQVEMLDAAFARRDAAVREAATLSEQLDDYRRLVAGPLELPLTSWLLTLREGGKPLTPVLGGPLSLAYGTGRAFMAAARGHGLHAVREDLARLLPADLPQTEEGWPPENPDGSPAAPDDALGLSMLGAAAAAGFPGGAGQEGEDDELGGLRGTRPGTPQAMSEWGGSTVVSMAGRGASFGYPPSLPQTWLRFVRAPLSEPLEPPELQALLAALAAAKLAADRAARRRGLPHPDLHVFVYKHILAENPCAADADEVVVRLVQSLKAHAKRLPRAGTWQQLLQVVSPVLPPDACDYYCEVFCALITPAHGLPPPLLDPATGTVWVPSGRWKAVLTSGPFSAEFDTERRSMLMKQAAAARMDTTRGNPWFGMTDADALMAAVMNAWLAQRQAAIESLGSAWQSVEPLGSGLLSTSLDVDALARVARTALGGAEVPDDRDALLELYSNTVQAARRAQAAARIKWSGLTPASLADALAGAGLLPPRPVSQRASQEGALLAAAAAHVIRIADSALAEMRGHTPFRSNEAYQALDAAAKALKELVKPLGGVGSRSRKERSKGGTAGEGEGEAGAPTSGARWEVAEARRVAAGWAALDELTAALLTGSEALRLFETDVANAAKETAVRLAVEAVRRRSSADGGGKGGSRPSSGRRGPRATRNLRGSKTMAGTSTSGAAAAAAGVLLLPDDLDDGGGGGGSPSGRAARGSGAGRSRPQSGRSARSTGSGIWGTKDLKSVLASGKWDSDEEGEGGLPPTLQLRRPTRARGPGGSRASSAGGGVLASPRATGVEGDDGGAGGDGFEDEDVMVYEDDAVEGSDEFDQIEGGYGDMRHMHPAAARLGALEGKYGRLRARYEEAMKALTVAFRAGGGGDGGGGGGDGGALGLPPRAVLESLSPAVRLRLIAELLAEVHREVEGGVWPRLAEAVAVALGGGGGGRGADTAGSGGASGGAPADAHASVSGWLLSASAGAGGGGSRPASAMAPATGGHAASVWTAGTLGPRPASGKTAATSAIGAAASSGGAGTEAGAAPMAAEESSSLPSADSQHGSASPSQTTDSQQPPQPQLGAARISATAPAVLAVEPTASLAPAAPAVVVSAEAQELAGRLHAHAGVVGQAVATAAVQAAALAAALEDLDTYGARRGASAGRRMSAGALWSGLRVNVAPTTPGGGAAAGGPGSAAGSPRYGYGDGGGLPGSGSQPGSPSHVSAMGAWPGGPGGVGVGGGFAAGSAFSLLRGARPSSGLSRGGGGGAGPWSLSPLALSNLGPGGGLLGSPRPGTGSGATAAAGASTHRSAATARSGSAPGEGGWPDQDLSRAGTAPQQQQQGAEYEAFGYGGAAAKDSDPRDTMYLDALRALHLAAEGLAAEAAEADGAGAGAGQEAASAGATAAVRSAVAALVALMGGQPRVTAHGRIIEFFPRRIPKDWRHPLLRSSLTRLYVYTCGALLQQHERAALLREAGADLAQRHAALAAAAEQLTTKAAALRGLQAALGSQMAALAAWVGHGSVLVTCLGRLGSASAALQERLAAAAAGAGLAKARPLAGEQGPGPHVGAGAGAADPAARGGGGVRGDVVVTCADWQVVVNAGEVVAQGVALLQTSAAQLAVLAAAGVHASSSAEAWSRPPAPGAPVPPPAPPPGPLLLGPLLPSGDQILSVQVTVQPQPQPAQPQAQVAPAQPQEHPGPGPALKQVEQPQGAGAAPSEQPQQLQQQLRFIVDLPAAPQAPAGAAGAGRSPAPAAPQAPSPLRHVVQPTARVPDSDGEGNDGDVSDSPPPSRDVTHGGEAAGGSAGVPQYPELPTPPASPVRGGGDGAVAAVVAPPAYSLQMALKRAERALASGAAADAADPSALPPGEALITLSNSMLARSSTAPSHQHQRLRLRPRTAAAAAARGGVPPLGSLSPPPPPVDGWGPLPPHYERRPLTARAFVEGVMAHARQQQIAALQGPRVPMPHGALPVLDAMAAVDAAEAAALQEAERQRALLEVGVLPYPATALETLLWQHREQAAAAGAAAADAVAAAAGAAEAQAAAEAHAAAAAAGRAGPPLPGSFAAAAAAGRGASPPRLATGSGSGARAPSGRARGSGTGSAAGSGAVAASGGGAGTGGRLAAGVSGARIATLPPMGYSPAATTAGQAADGAGVEAGVTLQPPRGVHLGYYPGLQVDASGRAVDWRLPLLMPYPSGGGGVPGAAHRGRSPPGRAPAAPRQ